MAPKNRKSISVSAIFKKYGAPEKDHAKTQNKSNKISRVTVSKKHAKAPEHSLARDFSEKIELSRAEILQIASTKIESTHHILLKRLATTSAQSANFVEEATIAKDDLTRPLAQERLQFMGKDGKSSGIVLLGDRMKRLQKVVAREQMELANLWKEWAEVQELIVDLGIEMLGSEGMKALAGLPLDHENVTESTESMRISQETELEKQKLSKEIDLMSVDITEKSLAGEKDMKTRTQKQRQEFLTALGADY